MQQALGVARPTAPRDNSPQRRFEIERNADADVAEVFAFDSDDEGLEPGDARAEVFARRLQ